MIKFEKEDLQKAAALRLEKSTITKDAKATLEKYIMEATEVELKMFLLGNKLKSLSENAKVKDVEKLFNKEILLNMTKMSL
jgi:hypothetical protein